jgi:N-acetylglutamate synthase-like GNAT family acetyltransferase
MNYKLTIESELSNENLKIIEEGLRQFDLSKKLEENIPISILLKNEDNKVIGGLQGNHNSNWLYINALWVDSLHRGKGYGRQMMLTVEEEAVKRGVSNAYLQTNHSSGFYQKLGYEIFAVIENSPTGFNMNYLKKSLK